MIIEKKEIQNYVLDVTISVEKEEFDQARREVYLKHTDIYPVSGYAGGMAPLDELEKNYGPAVLYDEALEVVVPKMFSGFLSSEGLRIVCKPSMYDMKFNEGGVLFSIKADLYPDVKLGRYKGLSVPYRRAGEQDLFERAVIQQACMNMVGEIPPHMIEQKLNEIIAREKLNVSNEAIYHLLADAEKILSRGYAAAGVNRRPSQIKAESMDLMVQTVSEEHQDDWQEFFKDQVKIMAERYHSPLPEGYDEELQNIIDERMKEKNEMDKDKLIDEIFDSYLNSQALTRDEWKKKRSAQAAREVCVDLLLDSVAEKEHIGVNDTELHEALENIGSQVNMSSEEVEEKIDTDPVRWKLMRDKALTMILDSAVTDEEGRVKRLKQKKAGTAVYGGTESL